jgi:hypothetical protein
MVEGMGIQIEVPTNGITFVPKYYEDLPSGSKVISGGHTEKLVI